MNVLLVEDEDRIASFVEKALQRRGFDVRRVVTGGEALGAVSADVDIVVGNQAPVVELVTPVADQEFGFGDTVTYEVRVTDDQEVDCSRVSVTYVLGHDTHGHPQSTAYGCTGSLTTTVPEGHDPATDDLAAVFVAEYTDAGSEPPLSGSAEVVLEPAG